MKKIALVAACMLISSIAAAAAVRPSGGKVVRPGIARSQAFKLGPSSSSSSSDIPTSGLFAWYKADAITGFTNGQALTSWTDSSSNGYTLTAVSDEGYSVSTPTYRTNQQNSLPGVDFSYYASSNDVLANINAPSTSGAATVFSVVSVSSIGSSALIAGLYDFAGGVGSGIKYGLKVQAPPFPADLGIDFDGAAATSGIPTAQGTPYTIAGTQGASSNLLFYVNGDQVISDTGSATSINYTAIKIIAPLSPVKFKMHELILYNRQMDATEMESILSYLRTKWAHY